MHIPFEKERLNNGNGDVWHWSSNAFPASVVTLGETTSVLDDAWALLEQGQLCEWDSVLAYSQSEGRGQTRRQWYSPSGNVYAAMRLPAENPFLTTAAAPALSALIATALESLQMPVSVKWPNDLVVVRGDAPQKVGGILLEERNGCIMAGIGMNIAHAPETSRLRRDHAMPAGILDLSETVKKWTSDSPKTALDLNFSPVESLWLQLVSQMYFWYTKKLPAPYSWRSQAEKYLLWRNRLIRLCDGGREVCGMLQGLGPAGELRLVLQGHTEDFLSGSISLAAGRVSLKGQQHE